MARVLGLPFRRDDTYKLVLRSITWIPHAERVLINFNCVPERRGLNVLYFNVSCMDTRRFNKLKANLELYGEVVSD